MRLGTKRKASTASPDERPNKMSRRSTSSTVVRRTSTLPKASSSLCPPPVPRSSSLRSSSGSEHSEPDILGARTPPALRRASTLPLEDETSDKSSVAAGKSLLKTSSTAAKSSLSRKSSSAASNHSPSKRLSTASKSSLSRKSSSVSSSRSLSKKSSTTSKTSLVRMVSSTVLEEGIVTTLKKLPSGSVVGESVAAEGVSKSSSMSRSLSKKSSLAKPSSEASLKRGSSDSAAENEEHGRAASPVAGSSIDVDVPLPPGGLLEVAISFDTTGSMYGCLDEVRAKVQDLIQRLQADIPGIRIAIIAHGDYCDVNNYIIKWIDFGSSLHETLDFVNKVDRTGGGDGPECYELVLLRARDSLSWTPGSQRVLVVIGDDEPHPVGYTYGAHKNTTDWREESRNLRDMGVTVYGVQSGSRQPCTKFMDELAAITGGKRLTLANFSSIFDFLMMICYREGNPEMIPVYEAEIRGRGGMAKDMENLLVTFGTAAPALGKTAQGVAKVKARKSVALKVTAKKEKVVTKETKGVKKAAPKKTTPAATSKKSRSKKVAKKSTRKQGPKKLLRESIPDSMMSSGPLKILKWTPWLLAISQTFPKGQKTKNWTKCRHLTGYRRNEIFGKDSKVHAIYEFAVQLPGRRKKYAMYFRRSIGYKTVARWDMYMLRHRTVRQEVDRLVNGGCSIFVRRGVMPSKQMKPKKLFESNPADEKLIKINTHIRKTIDYAWRKHLYGKKKHRKVIRNKVLISSDEI